MLVIDVAAVLLVLGMGIVGFGFAHKAWKKRQAGNLRHQAKQRQLIGSTNVVKMDIENEQKCAYCGSMTEVRVDLFVANEWYHRSCYEKLIS